jgi:hypothetical protein
VPAVPAATALAMSVSYSSDRTLASQYRAALQGAHRMYFRSARLNRPAGHRAGIVLSRLSEHRPTARRDLSWPRPDNGD